MRKKPEYAESLSRARTLEYHGSAACDGCEALPGAASGWGTRTEASTPTFDQVSVYPDLLLDAEAHGEGMKLWGVQVSENPNPMAQACTSAGMPKGVSFDQRPLSFA